MTDVANSRSASLVDSASDSESITDCLQEKSDEISNVASDISSNTDDIVGNGITIKITTDDAVIVSADATDDRQNKSNDGAVSIGKHNLYKNRNHGSFYPGHHRLASLPYTGIPYSGFSQDEDLPLNFDDPLVDDSSYPRFGLKSDSDWDISSPMSSTPGYPSSPSSIDPFTSLPLSPNNFMHSFLDDDELAEKQLMLEEERMILQMRRQELDNAIYKLHYQNFDSSLNHSLSSLIETRYKRSQTPPQTKSSSSTTPSLSRQTSFTKNLSPPPPRFQPIGLPVKKPTACDYSVSSTMSSSAPSHSTFSLFSKSPGLSLNHTFLPTVNEQKLSSDMSEVLDDDKLNEFSSFGYPLTPSGTPPKNDSRDFIPSSLHLSTNHFSPKVWSNNNDVDFTAVSPRSKSFRSLPKRDYYSAPTTPNYYTPPTPQFNRSPQHTLNPLSIGQFTRASSLYSSPVDERDELWHGDEAFNPILTPPPEIPPMNKFSPSINNENNLFNKNNSCHQFHNIVHPKLLSPTHKTGGEFFSLDGNQATSDSHYNGLTHDKGIRVNGLYKLEVI
ncbi:14433_t:CDS:2 [Racocetra fulgida]|uniref:14433_t:CDS:1 n=1 Tax=Racocetra fulgida TaxID=60492 RepID=A0A9N9E996_9GLOM|nr:14433_t:CDS:2 [Racocetra fulgida]